MVSRNTAPSSNYLGLMLCRLSAGKASLARTLAGLAGQELVELALNGGTDTSDLLGGFEQLEPGRRLQVSCPMLDRSPCMGDLCTPQCSRACPSVLIILYADNGRMLVVECSQS